MKERRAERSFERACAEREEDERRRRGQRERAPRGERAEPAGAQEPQGEADLAARGARQELAERDKVGEGRIVEPAALDDEGGSEIAEMRDGAAERGEAEPQESGEDLARAAGRRRGRPPHATGLGGALVHRARV